MRDFKDFCALLDLIVENENQENMESIATISTVNFEKIMMSFENPIINSTNTTAVSTQKSCQ